MSTIANDLYTATMRASKVDGRMGDVEVHDCRLSLHQTYALCLQSMMQSIAMVAYLCSTTIV